MSLETKTHKGGRKFKFMSRRKTQSGDFRKDSGDLVQMVIIIAAIVVAAIIAVGGISIATQSKGKSTAECINNSTNFGQGAVARENCKKSDEEAQEKGEEAIGGNFGGSSPIGGSEPEEETKEEQNPYALALVRFGEYAEDYHKQNGIYPRLSNNQLDNLLVEHGFPTGETYAIRYVGFEVTAGALSYEYTGRNTDYSINVAFPDGKVMSLGNGLELDPSSVQTFTTTDSWNDIYQKKIIYDIPKKSYEYTKSMPKEYYLEFYSFEARSVMNA